MGNSTIDLKPEEGISENTATSNVYPTSSGYTISQFDNKQTDSFGNYNDDIGTRFKSNVNYDDISSISTELGTKLIRNVYIDKLKKQFEWLSKNHDNDDIENSIAQICLIGKYIKEYKKHHYNDIFYKFVVALNISLFYNEDWKKFPKDKFTILNNLMDRIKVESKLDNPKVFGYLNELEKKGFQILPF